MTKKIDLESLCIEARSKGLNMQEIEHMKRHYFAAMLDYAQKHEPKGPGITAALDHLHMQEWTGYAAAASYIRHTIDQIQKGEKK